jgi:hypothetical protein
MRAGEFHPRQFDMNYVRSYDMLVEKYIKPLKISELLGFEFPGIGCPLTVEFSGD